MNNTNPAVESVEVVERWHVVAFREAIYQAHPGAPTQAGGCCERCSQGIRYVVTVKSSLDGRTMDVGRDCAVTLTGGPELAEIRNAERAYWREQRRIAWETEGRERAERERVEREEREAANAERNLVVFADLLVDLDLIAEAPGCSDFEQDYAAKFAAALRTGRRIDGPSLHVTRESGWCEARCIKAALACAKGGAPHHHSAAVGERVTVRATLVRRFSFDTEFGTTYVQTFRAVDGSNLVWKSSTFANYESASDYLPIQQGDECEIVATIKDHGEYKGTPQTAVTRAKCYRIREAPAPKAKRARKA